MPCRKKRRGSKGSGGRAKADLDEEAIAILKALASLKEPAGCSKIAEIAGLPTRKVTGKLRGLLNRGLVSRPSRGVYVITDEGRKAVS